MRWRENRLLRSSRLSSSSKITSRRSSWTNYTPISHRRLGGLRCLLLVKTCVISTNPPTRTSSQYSGSPVLTPKTISLSRFRMTIKSFQYKTCTARLEGQLYSSTLSHSRSAWVFQAWGTRWRTGLLSVRGCLSSLKKITARPTNQTRLTFKMVRCSRTNIKMKMKKYH